nr:reverse transcriptase domain-containing protein [Tanacetum cinerariifolium]
MTAILKQFQATPPLASVKAVEEIYVTWGGAHPYYQCLTADGNTFLELRDNIQGYVSAAAVNYNQGKSGYRPPGVDNQIRPPGFAQPNVQNNQNRFSQPQGCNRGNNFNQDSSYQAPMQQNQVVPLMTSFFQMNTASTLSSGPLPSNTIANLKGKLKAITTQSGIVLDGPSVHIPPPFINPEEDERVEETLTDPKFGEFTIKVPPTLVQKPKPPSQRNCVIHQRDLLHPNIPYPSRMHKQKQEDKDEAICTPVGIARDVFILFGKFTFPADFVIIDYESDPRVPLILGRPFLQTTRALIDAHGEEMILQKINESKLLIDKLDLPKSSDFLPSPEYDLFLFEDFFEVDALPSTNNEDKVFNPGILIQEDLFEVTTRVAPDKNVKMIAISHASLILEDFNPPLYELPFHKEVPGSETLL